MRLNGSIPTLPRDLTGLRVAIVHYWFIGRAGGERVVEAFADLFPSADLFALIADPNVMAPGLRNHKLTTSFLQRIPGVLTFHRHTLALQPIALEEFDLSRYDLVISSESGPAKGVVTGPKTLHICYCHSPMRYIWDMHAAYASGMLWPIRPIFRVISHWVRIWDLASSSRVDRFVANSHFVSSRIAKYYRRSSAVINPPVEVKTAAISATPGRYYLSAGRLVDYKRVDLAVQACRRLGRPLKVVGDGPIKFKLKAQAGPATEFLGRVSDEDMKKLFAGCRALLFPGEEDFGIVPVEVQAHGRPVIAFSSGGALETVVGIRMHEPFRTGTTGVFFEEQTVESLIDAISYFESVEHQFEARSIHEHALQFDTDVFRSRMREFIIGAFHAFQSGEFENFISDREQVESQPFNARGRVL